MRFPSHYWHSFEFPSMEKLNDMLDRIEYHVRNRRSLSGLGRLYTSDPGTDMEHWASAIRTKGFFSDVQEALDYYVVTQIDHKLPFITVAPKDREYLIKADYYIASDYEDSLGFEQISRISEREFDSTGGVIFFHPGTYKIRKPAAIHNRVMLIGELSGGVVFDLTPYDVIYPTVPYITMEQYSGNAKRPTIMANIAFDNISFTAVSGSSMWLHNCLFRYKFGSNYSTSSVQGLIETVDLSDATTTQSRISNCDFISGDRLSPGSSTMWLPNRVCTIHKYGNLHIHGMRIRRTDDEKWFRTGIIVQDNATDTRLTDCDLRTYDDCLRVRSGKVYIDNCGFYREFDRSDIAAEFDF